MADNRRYAGPRGKSVDQVRVRHRRFMQTVSITVC